MMFFEQAHIVPGIAHQTGGSARSGDWVSLAKYGRVGILVSIYQGAANTTAITVDKATSTAPANEATGITMANWWYLLDVTAGTTVDTWVKGTAAASITSSATGSGTSYYWIEIRADELPNSTQEYSAIQVELGASAAGNILYATYFMMDPRESEDLTASAQ